MYSIGLRTLRISVGCSVEDGIAGRPEAAGVACEAWPRVTLRAADKKAADFIKFWWGLLIGL